jgi:predicted ester cyclase
VVSRLVEDCVNTHRSELLGWFVAADVRVHPGTRGAAPDTEGLDALQQAFAGFRLTFPDLHITPDQFVAEHDLVALRWTTSGTHSGPLAGIEPTGRHVTWGGPDTYRLVDGKVAEWWRNDDAVWLLHQPGPDLAPAVT